MVSSVGLRLPWFSGLRPIGVAGGKMGAGFVVGAGLRDNRDRGGITDTPQRPRVNADNIRQCLAILRDSGYTGHLSLECEGQGGPLLEKSLAWLRATLADLNIPEEK